MMTRRSTGVAVASIITTLALHQRVRQRRASLNGWNSGHLLMESEQIRKKARIPAGAEFFGRVLRVTRSHGRVCGLPTRRRTTIWPDPRSIPCRTVGWNRPHGPRPPRLDRQTWHEKAAIQLTIVVARHTSFVGTALHQRPTSPLRLNRRDASRYGDQSLGRGTGPWRGSLSLLQCHFHLGFRLIAVPRRKPGRRAIGQDVIGRRTTTPCGAEPSRWGRRYATGSRRPEFGLARRK